MAESDDSWGKMALFCCQYFTCVPSLLLLQMQSFCGSGFQPRKVWVGHIDVLNKVASNADV